MLTDQKPYGYVPPEREGQYHRPDSSFDGYRSAVAGWVAVYTQYQLSAATAPLLARIAELDRSLDVIAQNTEAQAHASLQREIELTEKVEKLTRELEEARRKAQEDNYEFNRAINFAIDQGSEACHFLSAWREGDPSGWPEFNAAIKEQT